MVYIIFVADCGTDHLFWLNMATSPAPFSDIGKRAKGIPDLKHLHVLYSCLHIGLYIWITWVVEYRIVAVSVFFFLTPLQVNQKFSQVK